MTTEPMTYRTENAVTDNDWDSTNVDTDYLAKRMLTALEEAGIAAELIDTDEEVVDIRLNPTAWSPGPYGDCEHVDLAWRGGRGQWTLVGHWGRDSTSTDDLDGSGAESVLAVANIAGQIAELVGMATYDEVPANAVRQPVVAASAPVQGADPTGPQEANSGDEEAASGQPPAVAAGYSAVWQRLRTGHRRTEPNAIQLNGWMWEMVQAALNAADDVHRVELETLRAERDAHATARNLASEEYRKLEDERDDARYAAGQARAGLVVERARADKAEALVEHYRHRGEMTPSERQSILGETPDQARQPEARWIEVATRHVADNLIDAGAYSWWAEQAQQHNLDVAAVLKIAQGLAAALQSHGRPFDLRTIADLRDQVAALNGRLGATAGAGSAAEDQAVAERDRADKAEVKLAATIAELHRPVGMRPDGTADPRVEAGADALIAGGMSSHTAWECSDTVLRAVFATLRADTEKAQLSPHIILSGDEDGGVWAQCRLCEDHWEIGGYRPVVEVLAATKHECPPERQQAVAHRIDQLLAETETSAGTEEAQSNG